MRTRLALALAAIVVLVSCGPPPAGPTQPPSVNVFVNQVNGPNNSGNGSPSTEDAACAGITGNPELLITGGTFNGGKGKVNEPILARVNGLQIPSSCTPSVDVSTSGSCTKPTNIVQTVSQIIVFTPAPGQCSITACVSSRTRCASTALDVQE